MIELCGCFASFFCQAEDGIRDLVRSRGLGDVYKRQALSRLQTADRTIERAQLFFQDGAVPETVDRAHMGLSLIHI